MASNAKGRRWRNRLHEIIFESNTPMGKAFDVALLMAILLSIVVVMLDSIPAYHRQFGSIFLKLEWGFTILFSIEYLLRLLIIQKPLLYTKSLWGIIDLLAIVPTYLALFLAGGQALLVLRALRLLRIFRIFKLTPFLGEIRFLKAALQSSVKKIIIFMVVVITLVVMLGSVMYLVEGGRNGFTSIPDSIYWGIVTITTVGYGDISPATPLGKFVASVIMILGYGIIAVPTGIITTEMARAVKSKKDKHDACPGCGKEEHDYDARYCKYCGTAL